MAWKIFDHDEQFGETLEVGTIVRIEEDIYSNKNNIPKTDRRVRYAIVGHINESRGTNDEYTEDSITHFCEDFIPEVESILEEAKKDFEKNKIVL